MSERIKDVAAWGQGWQSSGEWRAHTIDAVSARQFVKHYLGYLSSMCGWRPTAGQTAGLDIGAGAGNMAAAFSSHGIDMVASEWNDAGIALIKRENQGLKTRKLDLMEFQDTCAWDLIFCRELYPFTRVNAFTDQHRIVSRLVDALKPDGILMLVGSDVAWPHCLDQQLLVEQFHRDSRLERVSGPYLEILVRRPLFGRPKKFFYALAFLFQRALAMYLRRKGWAAIYVITFRKNKDCTVP